MPPSHFATTRFLFRLSLTSLLLLVLRVPCSTTVMSCRGVSCCTFMNILSAFLQLKIMVTLPCIPFSGLVVCNFLKFFIDTFGCKVCCMCTGERFVNLSFSEGVGFGVLGRVVSFSK